MFRYIYIYIYIYICNFLRHFPICIYLFRGLSRKSGLETLMQSLKHLYSLYEDLLNQETNILHLKHKLSYVLLIRVQATISGDRLDPGNPAQHGGHSCSQRSERSAVFPRYQSAPSTSAPEAISCPRAAALESDLSILPPPHQPPPSIPCFTTSFFSSSNLSIVLYLY